MLTHRQEKFVQNLLKGMSQKEAYKKAGYSTKNAKSKSIDELASRLFSNPKVKERYKELARKVENKTILQAQELQQILSNIITRVENEKEVVFQDGEIIEIEKPARVDTLIKAIQELNKMQGNNLEKVEVKDVTPRWYKKK